MPQMKNYMVWGGQNLTHGQFLVFIGMWLIMATVQGFQRRDFWSNITIDTFETDPYRFNEIIPQKFYEDILKEITITDEPPPEYKDPF